jgi:hypothetical protein
VPLTVWFALKIIDLAVLDEDTVKLLNVFVPVIVTVPAEFAVLDTL